MIAVFCSSLPGKLILADLQAIALAAWLRALIFLGKKAIYIIFEQRTKAGLRGFEPPTYSLEGYRAIQAALQAHAEV